VTGDELPSCPHARRETGRRGAVSVADALREGTECVRAAGIDNPRLEARLLLAHALALTPTALLAELRAPLDTAAYQTLLARRVAHEPLAYITGHREFWSLDLAVSPATLIPRPETETLIEAAIDAFPDRARVQRILDLGTGTGALLLAALREFPAATGVGTDRNPDACLLARRNAAMLGMTDRACFLCADWAVPLAGRFDLALCNPPYIPTPDLADLMPEVARYEPVAALDGGTDGLDSYRRVLPEFPRLLSEQGLGVLELGTGQMQAVSILASGLGLSTCMRADLAGVARALLLRRTKCP
jgi:release factor glutamine methyltransferase